MIIIKWHARAFVSLLSSSQVMSRLVMIDDTDPSIQYSGPWFEVNNTQLETGRNGPPFNNTLHGVNDNANFSFNFSGSTVIVYGTSIVTINAAGTQDPTWECFIDNISIGSSPPSSVALNGNMENNWILCGAGSGQTAAQLEDGPHLLTVNANVANQQTFWFDQIQYVPSANVSLNQSILRIDASDPAIQYSRGLWRIDVGNPINYTSSLAVMNVTASAISGAFLTYEFSGTSISLFGFTQYINLTIANATYAIDDQEPITFSVGGSSVLYNQMLFETGQLSLGEHKLLVTYLGTSTNSSMQPIIISYFVQQDGLGSSSTSNTPGGVPSGAPTSISVPSGTSFNSSPGKPTEAIIGGVIGGLVLVSLLIALFFRRRRNNRRSKALSEMSIDDPSLEVVNPFTTLPLNPPSTSQPQNFTANGQSFPSQSISSKFSHRNQPSDPASSGGIPPLTPLRRPQLSFPAFISPSSESPRLPGSQTNLDGARPGARVPQATTEPSESMQRPPSPQRDNATFLWHEDSGVRIPPAGDNFVEFPPLYSPE